MLLNKPMLSHKIFIIKKKFAKRMKTCNTSMYIVMIFVLLHCTIDIFVFHMYPPNPSLMGCLGFLHTPSSMEGLGFGTTAKDMIPDFHARSVTQARQIERDPHGKRGVKDEGYPTPF